MKGHFPADGLVAVNVGHVFDVRLALHVLKRRRRDDHHPQIATCRNKTRYLILNFIFPALFVKCRTAWGP